jgi:hypothetical protein
LQSLLCLIQVIANLHPAVATEAIPLGAWYFLPLSKGEKEEFFCSRKALTLLIIAELRSAATFFI